MADPSDPTYVYLEIADNLAGRIQAGEFKPGKPLPGERQLAEEFGVALNTIRRALVELRDRDLVVTLAAKGTYVRVRKQRRDKGAGAGQDG